MATKYQETKDKYLKEKVETFVIRVPKGEKSIIQEHAKSKGKSLNSYVVDLIHSDMEKNWGLHNLWFYVLHKRSVIIYVC